MAATTFAADTPLAVTGIIADKGLSGNWLWIPVIGVHAGVFVIFAANWSRSGVITDAELVRVRYSGRPGIRAALVPGRVAIAAKLRGAWLGAARHGESGVTVLPVARMVPPLHGGHRGRMAHRHRAGALPRKG